MGEIREFHGSQVNKQWLIMQNVRRVFLCSAVMSFFAPLMTFVWSISSESGEAGGITKSIVVVYVGLSMFYCAASGYTIRQKDGGLATFLYRSYWLLFLVFSIYMINAFKDGGYGLGGYAAAAAVIYLVPLMGVTEQIYYVLIQAVFVCIMLITGKSGVKEIFDVIAFNVILYIISRVVLKLQYENFYLKDTLKQEKSNRDKDLLTGLSNRAGLKRNISQIWDSCVKDGCYVSALMIDIDSLQQYNNEFGFDEGDKCIKRIAQYIRNTSLRSTDIVSRIGGGKFLVFLYGDDTNEPWHLAEKIKNQVERLRIPLKLGAGKGFITVSIGLSVAEARELNSFYELYDEADNALLMAKRSGKNQICSDMDLYEEGRSKAN